MTTTKKNVEQVLASLSSLKRTLGIANSKSEQDEIKYGFIRAYTNDRDSAELLSELFLSFSQKNPIVKAQLESGERSFVVESVRVVPRSDGTFCAFSSIPDVEGFSKSIREAINRHTSPDSPPTKTRGR